MLGEQVTVEVFGDDGLIEVQGMGIRALLGYGHLADKLCVAAAEGNTHAGGDGLGKAGHEYDIAACIEALYGGQLFTAEAEGRIGVILNDYHIVFRCKPCDSLARFNAGDPARGILEGGDGVEHNGPVLADERFKLVNMDAVGMKGYGYELGLCDIEGLERTEEARLFDQYNVTGIDDNLADEVKALHGTGESEHILKLCGQAEIGENLFYICLAEREIALGRTVLKQYIGFITEKFIRDLDRKSVV